MGTLFVDKLDPQSGTALEIGSSGDTMTVPSGATLSIAGTINASSGTATGFGEANTPAFHAYLSSNQTVPNNTVTKINFNTELYDSNGCYDNSSNYRFTPGVAGKYFIYYQLQNQNQTDYIYARIRKNGSDIQVETHYTGNDVDDTAKGFTTVDSDADDYFEIFLQQTKGSDAVVRGGDAYTFFGAFKVTS